MCVCVWVCVCVKECWQVGTPASGCERVNVYVQMSPEVCVCEHMFICVCVCVRHLTWMVCVSLHEWGSLCICVSVTGLDLVTDEFVQVCVNKGVCVCVFVLLVVSLCVNKNV